MWKIETSMNGSKFAKEARDLMTKKEHQSSPKQLGLEYRRVLKASRKHLRHEK